MALTGAERAKRHREKIKKDKEKYAAYLKRSLERKKRFHQKRVKDVSEDERKIMREKWRLSKQRQKQREKQKTVNDRAKEKKVKDKNEIVFIEIEDDSTLVDHLQNITQDENTSNDCEDTLQWDYEIEHSENITEDNILDYCENQEGATFIDPHDLLEVKTSTEYDDSSIINPITETNKKIITGLKSQITLQNTLEKYKRNEQRLNLQIKSLKQQLANSKLACQLKEKENEKLQEDNDRMHEAIQEFLSKVLKREQS